MIFKDISDCLSQLRLRFGEESVAAWAEERDIGQETLCEILSFLKEVSKKKDSDAEAFLRKTSRLPSSSVRSFSNFDFTPFGVMPGASFARWPHCPSCPQGGT